MNTREKKLTNICASGRDENVVITPHRAMGLEPAVERIGDDELVEITPQSVRMRKRTLLQSFRNRHTASARSTRPRRRTALHIRNLTLTPSRPPPKIAAVRVRRSA